MASCDGRQVVGTGLHRRRTVIVRMTGDGRKLETSRIANSPQVVVEAAYGWHWAAEVLQDAGAEARLAHPLGVKAFTCRRVSAPAALPDPGRPREPARGPRPGARPPFFLPPPAARARRPGDRADRAAVQHGA